MCLFGCVWVWFFSWVFLSLCDCESVLSLPDKVFLCQFLGVSVWVTDWVCVSVIVTDWVFMFDIVYVSVTLSHSQLRTHISSTIILCHLSSHSSQRASTQKESLKRTRDRRFVSLSPALSHLAVGRCSWRSLISFFAPSPSQIFLTLFLSLLSPDRLMVKVRFCFRFPFCFLIIFLYRVTTWTLRGGWDFSKNYSGVWKKFLNSKGSENDLNLLLQEVLFLYRI